MFCLGQHRRHSTFNFPSITDVSITGADRAHPFEDSFRNCGENLIKGQASDVQRLDSAIHRISLYPVDRAIGFPNTYPLDSTCNLSGG